MNDENGLAVARARAQLTNPPFGAPLHRETDFAGRCEFSGLSPGIYQVRVEKTGFYASLSPDVQVGNVPELDISMTRVREVREVVDVVESPPAIDPAQISSRDELSGEELIDIPFPGPNDYHNALTLIPGVTPDGFGQAHVGGRCNRVNRRRVRRRSHALPMQMACPLCRHDLHPLLGVFSRQLLQNLQRRG